MKYRRTLITVLKALPLHFKGKGAVSKQKLFSNQVYSFLLKETIFFCEKHALGRSLKMGEQTTFILNVGFG